MTHGKLTTIRTDFFAFYRFSSLNTVYRLDLQFPLERLRLKK